jgi:hypothetical protein
MQTLLLLYHASHSQRYLAVQRLDCELQGRNFYTANILPAGELPNLRNLLNVVHTAQVKQGLRVASEPMMPSFALWHGLKISQPPQPWFLTPPHGRIEKIDEILNGGPPSTEHGGYSHGTSSYNVRVLDDFNWQTQQNWWWRSKMPDKIMKTWLGIEPVDEGNVPYPLSVVEGKVYAPNMALHPFKTNHIV